MLMMPGPARHHLAELLHAACGGNPLHTVEVIAALVDEELLTPAPDGTWQAAGAEHWPLPSGLREAIGRRIARLGPEAGTFLDAGAVLGHVFRRDIAASIAGLDPPAAEAASGELISRRLIRPVAGSEEMLEFVHELVTRVAYDRVPAVRRGRLHRAAARAWRGRRGDPAGAAAAARHARQARAAGRWRWWGRVGLAAAAALAVTVGVALFAIGPERRATLATLVTRPGATLVPNRIVVAPLANRTGDSTLAAIGDMAADWIARGLTRTAQFEVVDPRTAWMTAKLVDRIPRLLRPGEAAIAIAEETGSGLVVSGSYYRAGDSLRFEVQITDVASHNLSRVLDPVSAPIGEPASALPTLARRTVATVATAADTLSVGLAAGLSQPPSQQAYEEVSRAWESFWRWDTTDIFARTARARSLDAEYMPPRLMEAYVRSLQGQWPVVDSIVREVDEQRTRLTPVEGAILDGLHANLRGDRPGRVRAARDLARLTPGSFEGYTLLAEMALAVNDPHQALEALSHVDPDRGLLLLSPIYWQTSARALHQLGRYRDELPVARRGVRKFPDDRGTACRAGAGARGAGPGRRAGSGARAAARDRARARLRRGLSPPGRGRGAPHARPCGRRGAHPPAGARFAAGGSRRRNRSTASGSVRTCCTRRDGGPTPGAATPRCGRGTRRTSNRSSGSVPRPPAWATGRKRPGSRISWPTGASRSRSAATPMGWPASRRCSATPPGRSPCSSNRFARAIRWCRSGSGTRTRSETSSDWSGMRRCVG